jgi:hypothetical protein
MWCNIGFADDIRDFQIEGMSIGDSLLDYFSEEEIKKFENVFYPDNKYIFASLNDFGKTYERLQMGFKNEDSTYKIELLNGVLLFGQDIQKCYSKQNEIIKSIEADFENATFTTKEYLGKLPNLPKKIKVKMISAGFSNGSLLVYCSDHPKENNREDRLKVQIETLEMSKYLNSQQ